MTDPKAPPPTHDDQPENSPSDSDYPSDSDSEFFAKLDQILEAEAIEKVQASGPVGREPESEPKLAVKAVVDDTLKPADEEVSADTKTFIKNLKRHGVLGYKDDSTYDERDPQTSRYRGMRR